MQWPPNYHDINIATNIIYTIPMATIFGPNIPIPPGVGDIYLPTLFLNSQTQNPIYSFFRRDFE